MTMIGPASPKQICPECAGAGYHERGERMEYRAGWGILSPEHGEWVSEPNYVDCDICGGSGRVTKATVKWYSEQANQSAGPWQEQSDNDHQNPINRPTQKAILASLPGVSGPRR